MSTGAILLYKITHVVVGENKTFLGEESLLRERGIKVDVFQNLICIEMMSNFIEANPIIWNEDIGEEATLYSSTLK